MRLLAGTTSDEPIDSMQPHPANPRIGNVDAIGQSITEHGFYGTILVQASTRHIIAGNHRWKAAKAAGATTIPTTVVDITDDQALRILLVDNRSNDLATYNDHVLADLLERLRTSERGLIGTGYTLDDLHALTKRLSPDDDDSDDADEKLSQADQWQEQWDVQPGDLWIIPSRTVPGREHRLVCGDSTDPSTVTLATDGTPVDIVVTDPPYGVAYTGGTSDRLTLSNDKVTRQELDVLLKAAATAWPIKPGGAWYVFSTSGQNETNFRNALEAAGHQIRQGLVWVKNSLVLGHADYHYRHETIIYGWAAGADRFFSPDRTHTSVLDAPPNPSTMSKDELVALVKELRREARESVWLEDKPARNSLHPTTKPIHLVTRALRASSRPTERVFDGFNGSGTTGLAAEATGRTYCGIELEPRYVAVTLQRFTEAGLTPERAESDT